MSAWTRVAVLAAGAAVGAAAGRAAGSDGGRRAVGGAVERVRGAAQPAAQEPEPERIPRENRLGSRALRLAQDIRAGMAQAETEMREQLVRPSSPERSAAGERAALDPHGAASGIASVEQTIIDHEGQASAEADGRGT